MLARRHPAVFPLLLQRPASTPESRRVRDSVVASLDEAGLDPQAARRAERLLSTVILGFATSEAGGRFRGHRVIDEDFACLEQLIGHALSAQRSMPRRARRKYTRPALQPSSLLISAPLRCSSQLSHLISLSSKSPRGATALGRRGTPAATSHLCTISGRPR
jgi:hypothetical protein